MLESICRFCLKMFFFVVCVAVRLSIGTLGVFCLYFGESGPSLVAFSLPFLRTRG